MPDSAYRSRIAASSSSAVADARQVRDRGEPGLALDPHDQVVGPLACRAPGAVRHRDERRLQGLKLRDRREQLVRRPSVLGGKNSKLNVVGRVWKMSWMCMVVGKSPRAVRHRCPL